MKDLIPALVASGVLTVTAGTAAMSVIEGAEEAVGGASIATVVRAAQTDLGVHTGTTSWTVALTDAAAGLSQGSEAITVDGTVIRWVKDDACFEANVPDEWAAVDVQPCS